MAEYEDLIFGRDDVIYYSQFGEDRILADLFADKPEGFCIEVGANDGVNDSTTLYFEKKGWDCLLIEPNPELCEQIRASRTSRVIESAVSDRSGEVLLLMAEGAPRAHGVSTIDRGPETREKIRSYGFTMKETIVAARTLDDILQSHPLDRQIDFISIDVEGHELAVLRGLTLTRWQPRILLIEDNANLKDPAVRRFLRERGYMPFMRTGVNDWYAPLGSRQLVNWRNRGRYLWTVFLVRSKDCLKAVPGITRLRAVLARLRGSDK